jgi:hypothetical protein
MRAQREWPPLYELAGAGLGHIAFAAAVRARHEIEVAMHKLTAPPV